MAKEYSGHVGVVQAITAHAFALRPALELLDVLGEAVAEHLRARRFRERLVDARAAAGVQHLLFGLGGDVQPQQAAFERAVPHRVHALGADAELEARIRRAGEDRRIPAGEMSRAARSPNCFINARACRGLRGARHTADWWREIPTPSPAGFASASRPLLEADELAKAGARRVVARRGEHARHPHRRRADRSVGLCSRASASCFTLSQASAVVAHPAEKPK